jgi:flagellar biosynthesis protein FlhF
MRVKKFVARSLPEAMVQVKAELGAEAVILHTNEVRVGGVFGLFGHRMIQVTAAVEDKAVLPVQAARPAPVPAAPVVPSPGAQTPASPDPAVAAALQGRPAQPAVQSQPAPVRRTPLAGASGAAAPGLDAVREEMATMKQMMNQLLDRMDRQVGDGRPGPEASKLMELLTAGGVDEEQARALLSRVRLRMAQGDGTRADPLELLKTEMLQELSDVQTLAATSGNVVALVGPTGVGKTTTLAKLAAHLTLQQRKRVALITADTYRIAAVDQLRTYSEIIGVPLSVVYEPDELEQALRAYADRDVILVDTAGRSPRNQAHMDELRAYLEVLQPDETYLVMSLTSGYRDAVTIVDHYLPMGFDRFLFTKWDETVAPGLIYSIVQKYRKPLSYVTTGQNVPDDIEVADPQSIIQAILGD